MIVITSSSVFEFTLMKCPNCHSDYNHSLHCECGHIWMLDEVDDPDEYIKMRWNDYVHRWAEAVTNARQLVSDIKRRLEGRDDEVNRFESFRPTIKSFIETSSDNDWFRHDAQVDNDELRDIVDLMMSTSIPINAPHQYGINDETKTIINDFVKWTVGPFEDLVQYDTDIREIDENTFMKSFYHLDIHNERINSNVPCPVLIALQPTSGQLQGWNLFQVMMNELRYQWMINPNKTLDESYRYLCLIERMQRLGVYIDTDIAYIRNELYTDGYVGHGSVFMSEEVMNERNDRQIPPWYNLFVRRDGSWVEYDGGEIEEVTLRLL